jgi:hypothetical protein
LSLCPSESHYSFLSGIIWLKLTEQYKHDMSCNSEEKRSLSENSETPNKKGAKGSVILFISSFDLKESTKHTSLDAKESICLAPNLQESLQSIQLQ